MQCQRCLNTDPKYFYRGSKGWYCRRCISFSRVLIEEDMEPVPLEKPDDSAEEYLLKYPLTSAQKAISKEISKHMFETDILIEAVCGAGKTEMMVRPISMCLANHKKICFAIARRQVVLELTQRLREYFPKAKVTGVCGGHTSITDGDLIICTCHQLYRYYGQFDILILDEPDAFPFKGDPVLHGIARTACKGHIIYLTATPDEQLKRRANQGDLFHLTLNLRPHGHPLPVPVIHTGPKLFMFIELILWLKSHRTHPRLVFVPTIKEAWITAILIRAFMKCTYVTSHTENRDEVIQKFRKKKAGVLICTTVMERGVTIPKADIAVYHADSSVFDEAGLIQMAGRAGRSFAHPDGDVAFFCMEKSDLVRKCRETLVKANQSCIV